MRSTAIILAAATISVALASAIWMANDKQEVGPAIAMPAAPEMNASKLSLRKIAAGTSASKDAVSARIGEVPEDLISKRLTMPVPGIDPKDLTPQFFDARGERGHEAIDIMAPRGHPVVAAEDGAIAKLFTSVRGGLTIYEFDPTQKYAYYYAHLDHYAEGLNQGDQVRRGQIIGYVGSTGDAGAANPHLHFAIFLLGAEKQWWKGEALDPYPALTLR